MKKIKAGDTVRVRNQSGESFIEGYAQVVKVIENSQNGYFACNVLFPDDKEPVFRWIDAEDVIQWTADEILKREG